jgi:4-aminobutyrate aminotransferase
MPIGLTVAKPEVADAWKGIHISTFGGNPITNTAAKAVIDLIEEENLAANAADTGGYLRAKLEELQKKYPIIGDVRGMGLMQGLELIEDPASKNPAPQLALRLMEGARENRILIGRGGLYGNVIRISPPLNIQKSDVDEFITRLESAFRSLN